MLILLAGLARKIYLSKSKWSREMKSVKSDQFHCIFIFEGILFSDNCLAITSILLNAKSTALSSVSDSKKQTSTRHAEGFLCWNFNFISVSPICLLSVLSFAGDWCQFFSCEIIRRFSPSCINLEQLEASFVLNIRSSGALKLQAASHHFLARKFPGNTKF